MIISDKLRPHQVEPAQRLTDLLAYARAAVDLSDTGCHAPGTSILLFNGSIKLVEDLVKGDLLMGPDNEPRQIQSLVRGRGEMVRITPVKGDSFVVNLDHVLTLCIYDRVGGDWRSRVVDVSVREWLEWNVTRKHQSKLFRVPVSAWPENNVPVPPYYLGVLIGDGCFTTKQAISLSKPGPVMAQVAIEIAATFECRLVRAVRSDNNPTYLFRSNDRLWLALTELGLAETSSGDKFIPDAYKRGSFSQRAGILAGLLDTDGGLTGGGFDWISKSRQLAEDFVFVARSVGLAAYLRPCQKFCQTGGGGTYYRVGVSGNFSRIPLRLKIPPARRQIKNVLRTGFSVEAVGEGDYHGFSLTGDGRFLMGDFTVTHNTGKTYVAAAVAAASTLPTLVVCPKIVMTAWHRAAAHFGDKLSVINYEMLRTGRTPYGWWDHNPPAEREKFFVCQCCQSKMSIALERESPCRCHRFGIHCVETKTKKWHYGKFNFHPGVRQIIFDEVHRCNAPDSRNADLLIAAKPRRVLGLSATVGTSPMHFRALGYLLGLHRLGDFHAWIARRGFRFVQGAGWQWHVGQERQRQIMLELNEDLLRRGVRVRWQEIPNFPDREITSELYDLEESPEILDRLYSEMAEALTKLDERAAKDKAPDSPLRIILRARQKIELLKVPIFCELADDYRAKGFNVVHFVNFRQTVDEIRKRRKIKAFIDGTTEGVRTRQHWMDEFQANREREIVVNNAAGGVGIGLHDLQGDCPRVGLASLDFSADKTRQLFGRLHRDGGKGIAHYRVVLAAGTVEAEIHKALQRKLNNLDALNDADLMPENLRLSKASLLSTF